jgi:hypothetical protein
MRAAAPAQTTESAGRRAEGAMPDDPTAPKQEVVDTLVLAALAACPGALDEDGAVRLREHIQRLREAVAALAGYHLENGDEPDIVFGAISGIDEP